MSKLTRNITSFRDCSFKMIASSNCDTNVKGIHYCKKKLTSKYFKKFYLLVISYLLHLSPLRLKQPKETKMNDNSIPFETESIKLGIFSTLKLLRIFIYKILLELFTIVFLLCLVTKFPTAK